MPIKINLLAEGKEAQKARLRNPVKRAAWIAAFFVCVILVWMLKLGLDIYFCRSDYSGMEIRCIEVDAETAATSRNLIELAGIDQKLAALDRLADSRFLWAPVLGALETTMVDNIQVIRVEGDQEYSREYSRGAGGRSGKAAVTSAIVERITLTIEAKDTSTNGQASGKYKESLNNCDYFVKNLKRRDGFVLGDILRRPGTGAPDPYGQVNTFVLVSHFPEARRDE